MMDDGWYMCGRTGGEGRALLCHSAKLRLRDVVVGCWGIIVPRHKQFL